MSRTTLLTAILFALVFGLFFADADSAHAGTFQQVVMNRTRLIQFSFLFVGLGIFIMYKK